MMKNRVILLCFMLTLMGAGCSPQTGTGTTAQPSQPLKSMQMKGVDSASVAVDADAAAHRLAEAVRFATISNQDRSDFDEQAYRGMHEYLAKTFPLIHRSLKREVVGEPRAFSLLYTWEGKDPNLSPVEILAHEDVVPVVPGTETQWAHDAFSGDISEGYIWGRGTLDDKLPMMAALEAIEILLDQGYQPKRTVYLVFGQDEEVMGPEGAARIAALLEQRGVKEIALLLDEGGPITVGLFPGVSATTALIGIAEKGYLTLELRIDGVGGHSSMPPSESNIGILARAITRLEAAPFPYRLTPALRTQFRYLGPELPEEQHALLSAVAHGEETPNAEADATFIKTMEATLPSRATLHTTTAVTMVNAGIKENVLPPSASAVANFRILQGETVQSVTEAVKKAIDDPRITVTQMGNAIDPSPVSSTDGKEYALIEKTIRQIWPLPDLVVSPFLMVGGTDSKYFGGICKNIYRFTPVRVESAKDTERWHGVNERVLVEEYAKSIGFFYQFIKNTDEL